MTGTDAMLGSVTSSGLVAIVRLKGDRLELVRHPADGHVVAFENADAAFCFAVALEAGGAQSAGTVAAPDGVQVHLLAHGARASEVQALEEAA